MKAPQNEQDLFDLAYDTADQAYPIWRKKPTNDKPGICCIATGNILYVQKMFIYTVYNKFRNVSCFFVLLTFDLR